jgi:hypothetical protein
MKKGILLFTGLFLLLFSLKLSAQTEFNTDYFAGKWNVLVKGTPHGDARMFVTLEKKDTSFTGNITDTVGLVNTNIDKIEVNGSKITLYFTAQGYDVNLVMDKKDDDHLTGSLMGMFDAEGERMK